MRTVATIEARMKSSRLPGKVLLPAAGEPMLAHLVRRLRMVPSIHEIVLATTVNPADDVLENWARAAALPCYRGSEADVMERVIGAAASVDAEVIVEITADCPIIDPELVEQTIRMYWAHHAGYVSNCHIRSYPIGMDVQVFGLDTLRRSAAMTSDRLDREHVSLHMRNHPELFPHVHLVAPPELNWPDLGLTLDEPADYQLLRAVIEHFDAMRQHFSCLDVVRLLRARPEWVALNKAVKRKGDA